MRESESDFMANSPVVTDSLALTADRLSDGSWHFVVIEGNETVHDTTTKHPIASMGNCIEVLGMNLTKIMGSAVENE